MQRREFLVQGATVGATVGAVAGAAALGATAAAVAQDNGGGAGGKFKLKYAPHFDMLATVKGKPPGEQLRYGADLGFEAWEDNWLSRRPVEEQEAIGKALADLGMTMGIFVCHADMGRVTFAGNNDDARNKVVDDIKASVDLAKRVNAKWMTLVCDSYEPRLEWPYQMANCVDLLKRCAEVLEPHELVMVPEPLNWRRDHPGLLLHTPALCYEVCRAVDSPACKVLFDFYHTQIQVGNLIPNFDQCWDQIGYIQTGDNPGRNEPGTGEINYRNLFKHVHEKGYTGIVGMEHGVSKEGKAGEDALVAAYRDADNF